MSKNITIFTCAKCSAQFPKWSGRCLECGAWSTLIEESKIEDPRAQKKKIKYPTAEVINLKDYKKSELDRLKTGVSEVDRVFGGGIVRDSLVLLAGEPGIGKSTLLAQILFKISQNNPTLYISGEESPAQIKDRFDRLNCGLENIKFISETNIEKIISSLEKEKPSLVVVDSIQTVYSIDLATEPGSLTQIRTATSRFLEFTKQNGIAVILVGHITKDGQAAGPKTLEHMVDAVVYLETDNSGNYRILRCSKNRFGSTREIGLFEMTNLGLKEVKNPGSLFLETHNEKISGSVISSVMEGTRPFLIEIQALVSKTLFGYPQRKTSGFDLNRLQVLTAVLSKRTNINLASFDAVLNIVGGMKATEASLDLAVCMSIVSSFLNKPMADKTLVMGEVGLGGEIRNISRLEDRLNEGIKLGFESAIVPNVKITENKIKLIKVKNLSEAINFL